MMFYGIIAALFFPGYAVYGHPGIGHPGISAEIVGGQNSDKNEYPWQVMIKYSGGFRCGGSIVSQATILTSANCVNFDSAQSSGTFSVLAGEYDLMSEEGTEQEIQVATVIVHESFNPSTLDNDIAVLILTSDLTLTTSVQPIAALADKTFDKDVAYVTNNCAITGWGLMDEGDRSISLTLQEMTGAQVTSSKKCNKDFVNLGINTVTNSNMVCVNNTNGGACNGDWGGPLGCYAANGDFTQVGVFSYSPMMTCSATPQVFTRVSKYRAWIESNTVATA